MAAPSPPTNMRVRRPSRKSPKPGDVFVFTMPDERHRFGRVINSAATTGHGDRLVLIYIYDAVSESESPPLGELTPDRLLIPPILTNRLGWSRGYFEVVAHHDLTSSDLLERHAFKVPGLEAYEDEFGRRTLAVRGPMGTAAVSSYATIDDRVSRALGIPLVPDENRP